jgi:hypothetical protein
MVNVGAVLNRIAAHGANQRLGAVLFFNIESD